MVTPLPALACLVLALAVVVVPGRAGAVRLARLRQRPTAHAPRLPAVVAVGVGLAAGLLALGPAGGLTGAVAAVVWLRRRIRRRADAAATATAAELAGALGRITEELRAGAHPVEALGGTAADGPLARAVLAPAATAAALGEAVAATLASAAAQHPGVAADLRRVARTWALADRHGAPAAELLVGVVADIRWRLAYGGRVRAQLAGPRATAAVLVALPGLGIGLGELIGAAPLAVLRSGILGQALVVGGVGLMAAGAAWTERILRGAVPR